MKHSNIECVNYIKNNNDFILDNDEIYLLNELDSFYQNQRYGNFHPKDIEGYYKSDVIMNDILNYFLNKNKDCSSKFYNDFSSNEIKAMFSLGCTLNRLVNKYYELIEKLAKNMNVYTYEISSDTNAFDIYCNMYDSLYDIYLFENIIRTELLYNIVFDRITNKYYPDDDLPKPIDFYSDTLKSFLISNDHYLAISEVQYYFENLTNKDIEERQNKINYLLNCI